MKREKTIWERIHEMYASMEILTQKELFVCEYVSLLTTTVYHREQVDFYRLEKSGDFYRIYHYGSPCGYETMSCQEAYEIIGKLPLKILRDEAEKTRLSKIKTFDEDQQERWKRLKKAEYEELLHQILLLFYGKDQEERISDLKSEYNLI